MSAELGSTIELNEAQALVLDWIKGGCPEGVFPEDSYSHRVSARALHARGLIRVSGHGRAWKAEITERGRAWPEATHEDAEVRARLQKIAQADRGREASDDQPAASRQPRSLPSRPRAPKAPSRAEERQKLVDELTRKVIAAGGHLTIPAIDWRHDEIQWMERAAVRSPERPRGQVLSIRRSGYGEKAKAELSFALHFRDLVEETPVKVPERVARYHPAARELLDDKRQQRFTKSQLGRAARILHAIATEGERRGLKALSRAEAIKKHRAGNRDWRGRADLCFETEHGDYGFEIWESDGKLNMRQGDPPSSYGSPVFGDRKIVRLEDRITEAFVRFEIRQLEWADRKERWRIEKKQRKLAWKAAMADAETAYAASARWKYFLSLVEEAEALERYERFLELARRSAEELPTEQRFIAAGFLSEIEEHIRERNPATSPERLVPKIKKPGPDDLKPFLRGWSPYGPD